MNLLFNSDIVNLLLKTNEWTERQKAKIFFFFCFFVFFCSLESLNCCWVGGWWCGGESLV